MKSHRLNFEYGDTWHTLVERPLENYLAVLMRMARIREVSAAESWEAVILADDLQVPEDLRTQGIILADHPDVALAQLLEPFETRAERLCLYRDTCRMALADGEIEVKEREFLHSVAQGLGIEQDVGRQIFEDVTCQQRLQARFLNLLDEG